MTQRFKIVTNFYSILDGFLFKGSLFRTSNQLSQHGPIKGSKLLTQYQYILTMYLTIPFDLLRIFERLDKNVEETFRF